MKIISKIVTPKIVAGIAYISSRFLDPSDKLKYLFALEKWLYKLESKASIEYGKGTHTKHKHTNYHGFFIDNLEVGQDVLDIGCGSGELDLDIATKLKDVKITGVEINKDSYDRAIERNSHQNIEYVNADALTYEFKKSFDVVILSNVLEHIEDRINFLKNIKQKCQPKYFLVRVPMYERDWRIPLQDELDIDYKLDTTHYIEYRRRELVNELNQAGLQIELIKINWGEYWLRASNL